MTPLEQKLSQLATEALAAHGLLLVAARLAGSGKYLTVQILAENPDGSSPGLDDCARASRTLGAQLDVEDLINSRYVLEVSSPGLERPLRHAADYRRFIGRQARLSFSGKQMVGGQPLGAVTGLLQAADETSITLQPKDAPTPLTVPFSAVREAHLSPSPAELERVMKKLPLPGDVFPPEDNQPNT